LRGPVTAERFIYEIFHGYFIMIAGTEVAIRTIDRNGFASSRGVTVVFVSCVTVIANNRGVLASRGIVTSSLVHALPSSQS